MATFAQNMLSLAARLTRSFSFVGLAVATLFAAASLTPSLLPRHFAVQGVLTGLALAVGYGVGALSVWLWHWLGVPEFPSRVQQAGRAITCVVVAIVAITFLWWSTQWQNSVRQLMEMPPVATAYPLRVAAIALVTGIVLILLARALNSVRRYLDSWVAKLMPRRVANVVSAALLVGLLFLLVNDVFLRFALATADQVFLRIDAAVDEGIEQPTNPLASGSRQSLVAWDNIGRQGKHFVSWGPTQQQISEFAGRDAKVPLRVYVGLAAADTMAERAELALDELKRVGGFDRSVLVVGTPTGTGWLDPAAVDTLEYIHTGDTAIVSMQYSYLPSWITIAVNPHYSSDSARYLFLTVYEYWKTLPRDERPRLYLHGLSLGAMGSAASADLFTLFEDPIHGGVWSGPPFASQEWVRATRYRHADSPMWLPRFRDGSMLRFTTQHNSLPEAGPRWGPMRFVFVQHASDPMTFFSPDLLYRCPDWLVGPRGADVSPWLRWAPIITFLQVGFDVPMATSVPIGYGHNFAPQDYIDAWVEVTEPSDWSPADTTRLKQHFAEQSKNKDE
jgi:uncharacterized membrane protein